MELRVEKIDEVLDIFLVSERLRREQEHLLNTTLHHVVDIPNLF